MSPNTRIILEGLEAADDLLLTLKLLVNEHLRKKPKLCEHVKGLVKEGRRKVHEALREAVALDRRTTRNRKDQDYE
jgi:hypothetical protein